MQQSVVFTFLPQDSAPDGRLRAAVFVAPHLTPDGPGQAAADFPAFANWPAVVARSRVVVERADGQRDSVRPDTSAVDPDLWERYIAGLPVNGWTFNDLSSTPILSFPAQSIVALAQGLYHAVAAASGGGRPDPFAGGLRDLGAVYLQVTGDHPIDEPQSGREAWTAKRRAEASAALQRHIDASVADALANRRIARGHAPGTLPHGGPAPATAPTTPAAAVADSYNAALDLAEAKRFYDRPEARDPDAARYPQPDPTYVPTPPANDAPDFHSVIAALASHPVLLRALGLVIPIELDPGFVGAGADLRVFLVDDTLAGNPITVQPLTRTVVDAPFFQPVSDTGDIAHGMLLLEDTDRFDLAQVDVDSTALLLEQRVANVYRIAQAATEDDAVATDLPALRSTGFTLTRLARGLVLEQRIARASDNAAAIEAGGEVVLFAEDVVRGYRADVHDGIDWRSLMHRHVSYRDADTGQEQLAADDEAYLKGATLTQTPGVANPPAYLHEAVFGWDGWSLAVPRPGSHLPTHTPDDGAPPVTDGAGEPFPSDLRLHPDVSMVKGTLPRLRYGGDYRVRMRTVDLSGTSTTFTNDDHATRPHTFRRFQPIAHPTVVQRHAVTEGESTLRLVVRSGVDGDPLDGTATLTPVDPATYATSLNAATPRAFATYRAACERHLVPPKTSQIDSELLGRFDGDAIGVAAGADYRAAYARARREQGTLQDVRVLSATDPASDAPADGIHLVPPLARDAEFTAAALDATLAALGRGEAPEAGFAVVHDTDHLAVPYLPDHLASGVALRFIGSGTAAGWTHTELLPLTGPWPDIDTYRLVLADGPVPAVTVLDRAVTVTLPPGGHATVRSSSTVDASTLDLLGLWDWIGDTVHAADLPDVLAGGHQMITPGERITLVHATQRPLVRPALTERFRARRRYGETFTRFHGRLQQQAATTSRIDVEARWREWYDDPASGTPPRLVEGKTGHAFDLPVEVGADQIDLVAANPAHEFQDTIHRVVDYTPVATTRFREYLPPALAGDPTALCVNGTATTVHVPCSVRPVAPVVHSVMPTFRWDDLAQDAYAPPATVRRRRGGLRVWLERPWFVSGEDEMLGVVVSGEDSYLRARDLRRQHVSVWGKDPIRLTGDLPAAMPRPRDFRGEGLVIRDRLTLAEFGQTPPGRHPGVSVVGHPVTYSPERDLWYADIDVDPGEAAWPFLRLALTRFQPYAVTGAELSPVTPVDFVHLLNDRTATVRRPDDDTVAVTLAGIADRRAAPAILPPFTLFFPEGTGDLERGARAWIERRGPLATDLDWTRTGADVELGRVDEDEVARVWAATLELPESIPAGGHSGYRLVVAEWERLPYDDPFGDGSPIERLVYVDHFAL
jgi:hypothetical protein